MGSLPLLDCSSMQFFKVLPLLLAAAWPNIGALMYPEFLSGPAACPDLMEDPGCMLREVTCDECLYMLNAINSLKEKKIQEIIHFLTGDAYCGQYPEAHQCHGQIERLIPLAIPALGDFLLERADDVCMEIAGVC